MGITRLVGPIGGGAVLAGLGINAVVIIDAVSFTLSALLLWRMRVPLSIAHAPGRARPSVVHELLSGIRLCWRNRVVRGVLALSGFVMVGYGLVSVLTVVFVRTDLGAGAAAFGWMLAAQGIGITVAGLLGTRIGPLVPASWRYVGGLVFVGASMLVAFQAHTLTQALIAFGFSGAGLSAWMVGERTLLQGAVPARQLGRAFGAYNTVTSVLMLAGTMAAGAVGNAWGARPVLTVAAVLYLLPGVAGASVVLAARMRRRPDPDVVKRREAA
jgi:MFS family permease